MQCEKYDQIHKHLLLSRVRHKCWQMLTCFLGYEEKLRSTEKSKDLGDRFTLKENIF